ncbi:hypothetical protein D9981_07410, partial [Pseudoalteromonas phenolica O-BC30]
MLGVPLVVSTVTFSLVLTVNSRFSPAIYVSLLGTLTLETVGTTLSTSTLDVAPTLFSVSVKSLPAASLSVPLFVLNA